MNPLDEMLGLMLETWDRRYDFRHDRASRKAEFSLGDLKITAEEIEDGLIRVSLMEDGELFTKVAGPTESAAAIEAIMFPNLEGTPNPVCIPTKPWWRFW